MRPKVYHILSMWTSIGTARDMLDTRTNCGRSATLLVTAPTRGLRSGEVLRRGATLLAAARREMPPAPTPCAWRRLWRWRRAAGGGKWRREVPPSW